MAVNEDVHSQDGPVSRRTRGRPRLEDVADLEKELLDVALNEFLKNGYGGTSIAKIVKIAGISKTTLYSRFSSKRELFLSVMERLIGSNVIADMLPLDELPADLESGLIAFGQKALGISTGTVARGMVRLIYSEAHRFPEIGEAGIQQVDAAIVTITKFFEKCAIEEGIPCKHPEVQAEIFIRLMRGFHVEALHLDREIPTSTRDAYVKNVVQTMLYSRENW